MNLANSLNSMQSSQFFHRSPRYAYESIEWAYFVETLEEQEPWFAVDFGMRMRILEVGIARVNEKCCCKWTNALPLFIFSLFNLYLRFFFLLLFVGGKGRCELRETVFFCILYFMLYASTVIL